jgi:chaperonin GroES
VVGDTVFYKKYAGTEFEFDSKKFMIVAYADLLAKIVETEKI